MTRKKLAIIATHPIQYSAPVFRSLACSEQIEPKVFYTWSQTASGAFFDAEFGASVAWDIPLLNGYEHEFVPNVATHAGPHRFFGIRTPSLHSRIQSWEPDAVLVYGWNNYAHLQALRHFKGRLPVFFRGDSTLLDESTRSRTIARRCLLAWIYRYVDVAISVGQNSHDYFSWCGMPSGRIAFAPHCIDNQRFEDPNGDHQRQATEWRKQLGIGPAETVLVFAGKLIAKKDPVVLLNAFLRAEVAAHLVIFGSGELEPQLRALANSHANIHFMSFQNQSAMPAVYRVGDVFVLPSCGPGETWGLAINEAMACRRTVIASSKAGATRDLVREGNSGWSFSSGDGNALAALIRTAVEGGRDKLHAYGQNAYRLIQRWSVAESARKIGETVATHEAALHS